jgi:hypothetical protein
LIFVVLVLRANFVEKRMRMTRSGPIGVDQEGRDEEYQ